MIFKNMETLGVTKVQNVMKVGDTVSDILEGKNAGVISVGILEGSSEMALTEEEYAALSDKEREERSARVMKRYQEAGADYVIRNMSELVEFVNKIS